MKNVLVVFSAVAVILGIVTFFVVFEPTGSHAPATSRTPSSATGTFPLGATSSASISPGGTMPGGILPGGPAAGIPRPGEFASEYSSPYPLSWQAGRETFWVTGASIRENELTLVLAIQMGDARECVPLNLRLIIDEAGTAKAPDVPLNAIFTFPDTQSCNGTAGATYSQSVVFDMRGVAPPLLLTAGGTTNLFFQVATTSPNGVEIILPSRSG